MENLTAYELLDLAHSAIANLATFYALFLTLVSGYLVVAYAVGSKLTRSQVFIVNAGYLFTVSVTIFAHTAMLMAMRDYSQAGRQAIGSVSSATLFPVLPIEALNFAIVLGTLKFMWDVRHPKPE